MYEIRVSFWKINCCFYIKNLSFFLKKSVESIPSKLPGKRGESQLDCLSTKSFLARVVLSPLSPIFLKKNEIDFKKIYI